MLKTFFSKSFVFSKKISNFAASIIKQFFAAGEMQARDKEGDMKFYWKSILLYSLLSEIWRFYDSAKMER